MINGWRVVFKMMWKKFQFSFETLVAVADHIELDFGRLMRIFLSFLWMRQCRAVPAHMLYGTDGSIIHHRLISVIIILQSLWCIVVGEEELNGLNISPAQPSSIQFQQWPFSATDNLPFDSMPAIEMRWKSSQNQSKCVCVHYDEWWWN